MKNIFAFFFLSLFVFVPVTSAQDFWERVGPTGPNEWNRLSVSSDGKLYLFADTILVSSDNGDSWSGISTQKNYFVTLLANSPTDIFAADFSNLKRTTDGGATWSNINLGLSPISVRAIEKKSNGHIFLATNNHVFRSPDDGANWSRLTSGLTTGDVSSIAFANDGSVIAGTSAGAFRSTDNGDTWTVASTSPASSMRVAVSNTGTLIGGTSTGAWSSTDNGATWSDVSAGLPDSNILAVGADGSGNIFISTAKNGPYKSNNNGSVWTEISSGLTFKFINAFGYHSGNLYAVTRAAFLRSNDAGGTWVSIVAPFPAIGARGIYIHTNGTMFLGSFAGLFRSTDNGTTWAASNVGLYSNLAFSWLELSNGTLLMGTYYGGLFSSSDNGLTWSFLSQAGKRVEGLIKDGSGNLYHANDAGVFKSTNNGAAWELDTAGLGATYTSSLILTSNNSRYASSNKGLFRWKIGESQWTRVLGSGNFYSTGHILEVSDSTLFTSVGYSPTQGETGLWRSNDNGDTWEHLATPDSNIQRFIKNELGYIYLASRTGVYRSNNNGDSWVQVFGTQWPGTHKPSVSVNAFAFNNSGILFAATSAAVYRTVQTTLSVKSSAEGFPHNLTLLQNYPNPFNPSTAISFQLSAISEVTLKVYNVLGQEVATLLNTETMNEGEHEIQFDASGLTSGVYFYKLTTGTFFETKKMLLMK